MTAINKGRLNSKLLISTVAEDASELARKYSLGLEIAEFCTAYNMDSGFAEYREQVTQEMRGVKHFTFHACFNELNPSAIDPMILDVTALRYAQAYTVMRGFGISRMVVHSGFVPPLYFESYFAERSAEFWKRYLDDKPDDFNIFLENTLERSPDMLLEIVSKVDDERFRLCLDIGHAALSGIRVPPVEWIDSFLPYLGHVHLHNNYGEHDTHNALGDGNIDMAEVVRMIFEKAPLATMAIESGNAKTSVEWLVNNGFIDS